MKTLSILFFAVYAYLGPLGWLQWTRLHTTLLEENFEEMSENHWGNMFHPYFCTDSSSLVKVSPLEYR